MQLVAGRRYAYFQFLLLIVAGATFVPCGVASAVDTIRTVVISGRPIAGLPAGVEYAALQSPPAYRSLGASGHVIFAADLSGPATTEDFAMVLQDASGNSRLLAREGEQMPGLPEPTLFTYGMVYPVVNAQGIPAFSASTFGLGPTPGGIWIERNGPLELFAGTGHTAPGLPGKTLIGPSITSLSDGGHVAFVTRIQPGPVNQGGLWSEGGGNGLSLVVDSGGSVPGVDSDTFGLIGYPAINGSGRLAFFGVLDGPGIAHNTDGGIWAGTTAGDLQLLVREGMDYPGLANSRFSFVGGIGAPSINSSGSVAFAAQLNEPTLGELSGIWIHDGTAMHEIIRQDTAPLPTSDPNISFGSFGQAVLDDGGGAAFPVRLQGNVNLENDDSIWSTAIGDELRLVAREGDVAPENAVGAMLWHLENPLINKFGQVAFLSALRLPDNSHAGGGVFAQDRQGVLRKIVATGDVIDVENGPGVDLRTVATTSFGGWGDTSSGLPGDFNDLGQVLFWATFTDGESGFFISNVVAVPEPYAGAMLVAALGLLWAAARPEQWGSR